jgi:YggT family protein
MAIIASVIQILCYALIIAILVRVVFSWISPSPSNPIYRLAYEVTEPLLAPVRRLLPQTMGLDFSPMIVWFLLLLIVQLVGTLH